MKKIIVYVDTMNKSGGRERVIANLISSWVNSYSVQLITKDDGTSFYALPKVKTYSLSIPIELEFHSSRVHRIISSIVSTAQAVQRIKAVLNSIEYDYIYVSTPQNALECYLAMNDARTKLVVSEHAYAFAFNKAYTAVKRFVYPRVYCVSVPNKNDTATYKKWNSNAVYIPHLVTFTNNQKNNLSNKIALNIGRLTDDKRQDVLIDIWGKVKKRDWVLWIVGNGENRDKIAKKIHENGLAESIKLIPATKNIEDIYRQGSLFLFTSRWEGFGMVLLEAMSFGIPCISYDCPSGPADIIQDGVNGYLVKNDSETEFIKQLQRYIDMNIEEKEVLGNAAYDTVKKWDNNRIIATWDLIFDNMVDCIE